MQMNLNRLGLATVLVCSSLQAQAVGRLADVTVIDRNSGVTLPVYTNKGEYWVAGAPGARYAIAIRNKLGERVMAVTSVDGINVVSGATAAWGQTGYVFDAHYNYQITGWRKSSSEVAAFEFAPASDSYAERTGRPNQVGVIGVAVFRSAYPNPWHCQHPILPTCRSGIRTPKNRARTLRLHHHRRQQQPNQPQQISPQAASSCLHPS